MPVRRPQPVPDPADLDDRDAMALVVAGEAAGIEALIVRHAQRVASYLHHVAPDPGWVDDLVQEVFVRMQLRASDYDPAFPVEVWILRIARNLAIDLHRRERARQRAHDAHSRRDADAPHLRLPDPFAAAADREFEVDLHRALGALGEEYRTAFVLREIEGLDYRSIATVLGVPEKTVSSRLTRARALLRDRLRRHLDPDEGDARR